MHSFLSKCGCLLFISILCFSCTPVGVLTKGAKEEHSFLSSILDEEMERGRGDDLEIPYNSEAYYEFLVGGLLLNDEKYDKALTHYKLAASIDKEYSFFLNGELVWISLKNEDYPAALKAVDEILENSKNGKEFLPLKCIILSVSSKNLKEAKECYLRLENKVSWKEPL